MGDFPYPSGYMLNGQGELPAYPMRTACQPLSKEGLTGPALLEGLREAVGTFYNFSGQLHCYNYSEGPNPETDDDSNFWDYQACTEMVMPFSRNGGEACMGCLAASHARPHQSQQSENRVEAAACHIWRLVCA